MTDPNVIRITPESKIPYIRIPATFGPKGDPGTGGSGGGSGDVSSIETSSLVNQMVVFDGTTGKSIKKLGVNGLVKGTSGVLSAATPGTDYLTDNSSNTLTNKTFNANGTGNTISNLETADFATNVIDNDPTLTAASTTRIPTQAATKTYVDTAIAGVGGGGGGGGNYYLHTLDARQMIFNIQNPNPTDTEYKFNYLDYDFPIFVDPVDIKITIRLAYNIQNGGSELWVRLGTSTSRLTNGIIVNDVLGDQANLKLNYVKLLKDYDLSTQKYFSVSSRNWSAVFGNTMLGHNNGGSPGDTTQPLVSGVVFEIYEHA